MHLAVGLAVGTPLEPRFSDRSTLGNEPRHAVLGAIQGCHVHLRILCRTRPAWTGLRVARETLVRIEAGSEAIVRTVGYDLDFCKSGHSILEEGSFVRCKALKRTSGARGTSARAMVYRACFRL